MCIHNFTQEIANIQFSLADRVLEEDCFNSLDTVAGVDVSFSADNQAVAAVVVLQLEDLKILEKRTLPVELFFPYIPGFLGVREADAVISVLETLEHGFDVLMVNGHGVMHPRGFGLACHVGVLCDVPTIGVAKRLIDGRYIKRATHRHHSSGEFQLITENNRVLGAFFKGKYVSVGHKISLKTALNIVEMTNIFKTPEPIRQAHILATETFKQILKGNGLN